MMSSHTEKERKLYAAPCRSGEPTPGSNIETKLELSPAKAQLGNGYSNPDSAKRSSSPYDEMIHDPDIDHPLDEFELISDRAICRTGLGYAPWVLVGVMCPPRRLGLIPRLLAGSLPRNERLRAT